MIAEERLSLKKSLWFANQSRVKSLFCEAPLFPARGTSHKPLNKGNHDDGQNDHEEEDDQDNDLEVKEEKSNIMVILLLIICYYLMILAIIKQVVIKP